MDPLLIFGIVLVAGVIGVVFFMGKKKKAGGSQEPSQAPMNNSQMSQPTQPAPPAQSSQDQQSNQNTPQ